MGGAWMLGAGLRRKAGVLEGEKILMFLGAANRGLARWSDPDRFDVARGAYGHVGFGTGIRKCACRYVARLEAEAP